MGKVTNEFNRVADARRAAGRDDGDGRLGGNAGAANKIPDPRAIQQREQAAQGKKLHAQARKPKGPEPGR